MYLLNVVEHTVHTAYVWMDIRELVLSFNTVGQGSNSVSQAWQQALSLLSRLSHQGSLSRVSHVSHTGLTHATVADTDLALLIILLPPRALGLQRCTTILRFMNLGSVHANPVLCN